MKRSGGSRWRIRLTAAAEADYRDILLWTRAQFGERQAHTYGKTVALALEALSGGPDIPGARDRREIGPRIRTLHVARGRRRGRHLVVFRASPLPSDRTIEVLRILHDAMDLPRQVVSGDEYD